MTTTTSDPFNARFAGQCQLDTCERRGQIEIGDVCQYLVTQTEGWPSRDLMHMTCARRVMRDQAQPLCQTCWTYHSGDCL